MIFDCLPGVHARGQAAHFDLPPEAVLGSFSFGAVWSRCEETRVVLHVPETRALNVGEMVKDACRHLFCGVL